MSRFLLGINYWPRSSAMYAWERFDLAEIREDMARIKSLGLDVVRFFLLWERFQPHPDVVDEAALEQFEAVMAAIHDTGLQAMPTLFCGHMSGVNWLPAWTLDPDTPHGRFRTISGGSASPYGIGDFYADPHLLRAQTLFAHRVAERVRDHPALYAWDLGNEFSNLREPATPTDAAAWSVRLTETLIEYSNVGATGGLHGEDLERDRHIRPSSISKPWSFATMHGYPVYSAFARDRMDPNVVPFLMQVTQSCSGKRVLFSELGNPQCAPGQRPRRRLRVSRRARNGEVCVRRDRPLAQTRCPRRLLVVLGGLRVDAGRRPAVRRSFARNAFRHRPRRREPQTRCRNLGAYRIAGTQRRRSATRNRERSRLLRRSAARHLR